MPLNPFHRRHDNVVSEIEGLKSKVNLEMEGLNSKVDLLTTQVSTLEGLLRQVLGERQLAPLPQQPIPAANAPPLHSLLLYAPSNS
jgi:hypothetical protein